MTLQALGFYGGGDPLLVAPRTWFLPAFANVTSFETDDGLLLVDAGLRIVGPAIYASVRARTKAPLHTVVFTHGHVDPGNWVTPSLGSERSRVGLQATPQDFLVEEKDSRVGTMVTMMA